MVVILRNTSGQDDSSPQSKPNAAIIPAPQMLALPVPHPRT